jgi:hypothetical protein
VGWKTQAQKSIAQCPNVFCAPGGSGGGTEGVEWFRTPRCVQKRLHAYPELLLDWGQQWRQLKANGWQYRQGRGLEAFAYLPPGVHAMDGASGADWFPNETEAYHFVCR